jgi:HlyD family secretion protein
VDAIAARIVRIGLESDRVTEERRVYVACEQCPPAVFLGEQIEVEIETGRLQRARLLPATAVQGFDGVHGTVWVVRDGALARQRVRFAARRLDGRFALTDALPPEVPVAAQIGAGFAEGRAATVAGR